LQTGELNLIVEDPTLPCGVRRESHAQRCGESGRRTEAGGSPTRAARNIGSSPQARVVRAFWCPLVTTGNPKNPGNVERLSGRPATAAKPTSSCHRPSTAN